MRVCMFYCSRVNYEDIFKYPMMSLFVISACNLQCTECIMMSQMQKNSSYQMSLEEIEKFLFYTELSGYSFHYRYTGGEPLYWKNLEEGTKLIRKSKSCKSILLMTNGMAYDKMSSKTLSMIDYLRISQYDYNKEAIKYLKNKYPFKTKIVNREEFFPMPSKPVEEAVPVQCGNQEHLYFKEKVYACPHACSLALKNQINDVETGTNLVKDYCDVLKKIRLSQEKICKLCISNKGVAKHMKKIQNLSKYHDKLIQIQKNK